jgi:hypothetical protein
MKYFIQWVVVFSLIVLGLGVALFTGMFVRVNDADVTKLSFVILGLFMYCSIRLGISLARGGGSHAIRESSQFFADEFTKLGFIGTIAGFIYALYHTFSAIDMSDIASTQAALVCMATGMGTALYTTIAGLISSLLLRIQLFIYEKVV